MTSPMQKLLQTVGVTPDGALNALLRPGSAEHRTFASGLLRLAPGDTPPFQRTAEAIVRGVLNPGMDLGMVDELFSDVGPLWHASAVWAHLGFPVFDLTLDFMHAIGATDFGDVGDDSLPLPFSHFVLRLPENTILAGARSIFVYPLAVMAYDVKTNVARIRVPRQRETHQDEARHVSEGRRDKERATLAITDDGQRLFTQWPNGATANELLQMPVVTEDFDPGTKKDNTSTILAMARRVIANTLLYISSSGGLPPRGAKKLGADVPVEREHADQPRFRVGRPIRLGPQMRQLAQQRRGSPWQLAARFIVRGHWRNQAHGPAHTLRKRTWIQPHWKGPTTLTEALERVYEVE